MFISQAWLAPAGNRGLKQRRLGNPRAARVVTSESQGKNRGCMSISTPADVSYLPMIRSVSRQVAKKAMLDEQSAYDLALAVGEACANAIEHGSSGPRDEIQVVFAWNPEEVRVEVQDSGPGCKVEEVHEPPSKSERGFGIYLMRSLMDNVEFVCEGKGTKVVLVKRIKARNRAICKEGKESRAE